MRGPHNCLLVKLDLQCGDRSIDQSMHHASVVPTCCPRTAVIHVRDRGEDVGNGAAALDSPHVFSHALESSRISVPAASVLWAAPPGLGPRALAGRHRPDGGEHSASKKITHALIQ